MWLLYGASLRVRCVGRYTAKEGCVCVFCWKTADLTCLYSLNAALDEWHSETWVRRGEANMKEMIGFLPKKLQNWLGLGLVGMLFGQLVSFVHMLVFGKSMPLLGVLSSNFTSNYELGKLSAGLLVWFCGGVLVYWWQIGRKKE